MTDVVDTGKLPDAVLREKKGIPTVWIIPFVAALIGGWLWWSAMQEQGPVIKITFLTADGLEAGKTKIKYKDLEVGTVTAIDIAPNLDFVIVTAEMKAGSDEFMVENTRFWVVKPRIGAGGISGLGTIVSGAYINADISQDGAPKTDFTGLELPPARPAQAEGLRVKLRARTLGSLDAGTVISHLDINVGDVEGYRLIRGEDILEFDIYIEEDYADLVRKNTRFWNVSGISASLSPDGFELHVQSLDSIITGGVAFALVGSELPGAPAENGQTFQLFDSRSAAAAVTGVAQKTKLYFHEPLKGLAVGAPVDFQGIAIGSVVDLGVQFNPETFEFVMPVTVETYKGRLQLTGQELDETYEQQIVRLTARGLRAQLSSPNLVTGARGIELAFHPDTPATLYGGDAAELPELPTIVSTSETMFETLDKLPSIVTDLQTTMAAVAKLTTSDEVSSTMTSVAAASSSLEGLLNGLEQDRKPLLDSLNKTMQEVDKLLTNLAAVVAGFHERAPGLMEKIEDTVVAAQGAMEGGEATLSDLNAGLPMLQNKLDKALTELASGLRSIRDLTEYLERHPEALLKGKDGGQ